MKYDEEENAFSLIFEIEEDLIWVEREEDGFGIGFRFGIKELMDSQNPIRMQPTPATPYVKNPIFSLLVQS